MFALPLHGPNGEEPTVTAAIAIGDTLYAGFEASGCVPKNCMTSAGVFRSKNGAAWEKVVDGQARLLLGGNATDVFWVREQPGQPLVDSEPIHRVSPDTLAATTPGTWGQGGYATGLAVTTGGLFTMTESSDFAVSRLERRDLGSASKLQPASSSMEIAGPAYWLRADGSRLVWAEERALVVADAAGVAVLRVQLQDQSEYRGLALANNQAFAAYELPPANGAICGVDIATGSATVLVPARPRIQICAVAANARDVFWTQSGSEGSYCNQVWAKPVNGGSPKLVGCDSRPVQSVVATDQAVYWIGSGVHVVDPAAI